MATKVKTDPLLGRPEREIDLSMPRWALQSERILVTGASGALGRPLVATLRDMGIRVTPTDINVTGEPWGTEYLDITDEDQCLRVIAMHEPTLILSLAAQKLAVLGEIDPWKTTNVSVNGIQNLIRTKRGAHLVFASTCKAGTALCAYGIAKATAERLVLNAGGSVCRFVNVLEAGPSVLDVWNELPKDEPLPVTPCRRFTMSTNEAVALLLWSATLPAGRYALDAGPDASMAEIAARCFPDREQISIPSRRGDSLVELEHARYEWRQETPVPYIDQIRSITDAA